MAPDYDHLSLMQKVEVFEHALEHTQGSEESLFYLNLFFSTHSHSNTNQLHSQLQHRAAD